MASIRTGLLKSFTHGTRKLMRLKRNTVDEDLEGLTFILNSDLFDYPFT